MHPLSEFILGGQRSGKSRCGEARAADWLVQPGHRAVLLATALGGDDEMRARIQRHQADRAVRVPAMALDEVPRDLPDAMRRHSAPEWWRTASSRRHAERVAGTHSAQRAQRLGFRHARRAAGGWRLDRLPGLGRYR